MQVIEHPDDLKNCTLAHKLLTEQNLREGMIHEVARITAGHTITDTMVATYLLRERISFQWKKLTTFSFN